VFLAPRSETDNIGNGFIPHWGKFKGYFPFFCLVYNNGVCLDEICVYGLNREGNMGSNIKVNLTPFHHLSPTD